MQGHIKYGANATQEELTMGLALFDNSQSFVFQLSFPPSLAFRCSFPVLDYPPAFPEKEGQFVDTVLWSSRQPSSSLRLSSCWMLRTYRVLLRFRHALSSLRSVYRFWTWKGTSEERPEVEEKVSNDLFRLDLPLLLSIFHGRLHCLFLVLFLKNLKNSVWSLLSSTVPSSLLQVPFSPPFLPWTRIYS